jgi:uncharacterized protein (TIGR03083 family)
VKAEERLAALRAERQDVLDLCSTLSDDQWQTPSMAEGWLVRDVVAHLGDVSRLLVTPAAVPSMFGNDAEGTNDKLVAKRASLSPDQVLDEYSRWSSRAAALMTVAGRPPLGVVPIRVANLGWYPMRVVPSMLTFDTYVHLRHDIAPALDAEVPPVSGERLAVVVEWMMAGLEQMNRDTMGWLDRSIGITLTGPGGGTWRVEPGRGGRLRVRSGSVTETDAQITGDVEVFPSWSTTRSSWRDAGLALTGDVDLATRFLDSIDLA